MGLANLWLGHTDLAKTNMILASNWLREYTRSYLLDKNSANPDSNSLKPRLLISVLFSKVFSQTKFLQYLSKYWDNMNELNNDDDGDDDDNYEIESDLIQSFLLPVEVQIRFLMKIMCVLEASNCINELLDLAEYCLNCLAKINDQTNLSLNTEMKNQNQFSATHLSSILNRLHNNEAVDISDRNGIFLCEPKGNLNESQLAIYKRLADLEATLWTSMFKHQLALGNYNQAHMLLRSNPDGARRHDCLYQFIVTLCDRGEAFKLISFHYGTMESEFLSILESRAHSTDVFILTDLLNCEQQMKTNLSNPYYDVLYVFHINYANYRSAAAIMFEYFIRLGEEIILATSSLLSSTNIGRIRNINTIKNTTTTTPNMNNNTGCIGGTYLLIGLQRQAACLVSAINALYLVPKDYQWLVCPTNSNQLIHNRQNNHQQENLVDDDDDDGDDDDDYNGDSKDDVGIHTIENDWAFAELDDIENHEPTKQDHSFTNEKFNMSSAPKQILQLEDLLNIYSLVHARLRLAQACWEQGMLRAGSLSPQEVLHGLLSVALYDEAVRLCEAFRLDPLPIVNTIAYRCSELAQLDTTNTQLNPILFTLKTIHNHNSSISSNLNQIPILPGLSNTSSPIEYEIDLVTQSINNLSSITLSTQYSICEKLNSTNPNKSNENLYTKSDIPDYLFDLTNLSKSKQRNLTDLYWRLLEIILTRLDPPNSNRKSIFKSTNPGLLHLITCKHLLNSGPNQLHLPLWLTSRLLCGTSSIQRSTDLLKLYLTNYRIEEAYRLTMDMIKASLGDGPNPNSVGLKSSLICKGKNSKLFVNKDSISNSQSIWLPHNLFIQLIETLKELGSDFEVCKVMCTNLQLAMENYFTTLQTYCSHLITTTTRFQDV